MIFGGFLLKQTFELAFTTAAAFAHARPTFVSLDPSTRPAPREIAVGITECELVRLKNKRPTDVLIGSSGKGQREVQVLYSEPGSREIYMFSDNRLTRIVRPGQG